MRLKLASYNIHKAVGLDQRRDPFRIVQVINELNADVVALQEVDRRLGPRPSVLPREMIAAESDFEVVPFARNDVSLGWHGNAVLVRKGIGYARSVRLPLPGLEPRGAVRVTVGNGPEKITVFAAHLGLLREWRQRQLARLAAKAEVVGGPVAILGDFNEWSETSGCEPLERLFNVIAPGRTFHAARPIAALDRVALTKRTALDDCGVSETKLSRMASDHLPIWADVTLGS